MLSNDNVSNTAGQEAYYRNLTAFAKASAFDFTIGNPGTDTLPSYVGAVDVQLIYESAGLPPSTVWSLRYSSVHS